MLVSPVNRGKPVVPGFRRTWNGRIYNCPSLMSRMPSAPVTLSKNPGPDGTRLTNPKPTNHASNWGPILTLSRANERRHQATFH